MRSAQDNWQQVLAVAVFVGGALSKSLLVIALAFETGSAFATLDRTALLSRYFLAALLGYLPLTRTDRLTTSQTG